MIAFINETTWESYEALFIAYELNWVKGAFFKGTAHSAKCIQGLRSKTWITDENLSTTDIGVIFHCHALWIRKLDRFPDFLIHAPFGYVVVESSGLTVHRYFLFLFSRRSVRHFKCLEKLNCKIMRKSLIKSFFFWRRMIKAKGNRSCGLLKDVYTEGGCVCYWLIVRKSAISFREIKTFFISLTTLTGWRLSAAKKLFN